MSSLRTREWPLAVFTVALQFSCGLSLAIVAAEWTGAPPEQVRPLGMAVFPILIVGILVSLFHVGRPANGWRFLTNAIRSRLSQEVLLTGLFALAALFYGARMWLGVPDATHALGAITGLLGVLAVFASVRLYRIPSQPFWNAGWMPWSFMAITLVLGGCGGAMFAGFSLRQFFLPALVGGGILVLATGPWMMHHRFALCRMQSAGPQGEEPAALLGPGHWIALASYMLLAGVLPLLMAFGSHTFGIVTLSLVVAGALAGRVLMFFLPVTLSRF